MHPKWRKVSTVYGGAGDTPVAKQYGKTTKSTLCAKYSGK